MKSAIKAVKPLASGRNRDQRPSFFVSKEDIGSGSESNSDDGSNPLDRMDKLLSNADEQHKEGTRISTIVNKT